MHKKMSARRRDAFLRALEATGNVTLAAERACVSRSWVCLHRKQNGAFDAACKAAVAASFDTLRMSGSGKPPSGWGHLDGVELVVRGTGGSGGGKRVQIARARAGQWTARTEDRFLATLSATCNAKAAYGEAGKSKGSAYSHRKRWPAFARRWKEAEELATVRLELALVEHAGNPFSSLGLPDPAAIPPMTVEQALHSLYMHQHQVSGMGGRPGRCAQPPPFEETCRVIMSKIEAIERAERLSEADKAKDRGEWARRRGSGQALRRGSGQARRRGGG